MNIRDFLSGISKEGKQALVNIIIDELYKEDATNQFLENSQNNLTCPHCGSDKFAKNGMNKGFQRFVCRDKDCKKTFSLQTNTIFQQTKKELSTWYQYANLMFDGLSLKNIASKMNMNVKTAFYWRHKILNLLKTSMNEKLKGIVEADETFFSLSDKGSKKLNRPSKKRGESAKKRGISKDKVCVVVAVDNSKMSYSKSACLGRVGKRDLNNVLGDRIEENSILVVDGQKAYKHFSKENNLKLRQLKSGRRTDGRFNIQTVNQYHCGLKTWMGRFNGVATKYLDNYLTFFQVSRLVVKDVFGKMVENNVHITNVDLNNMEMTLK